MRFYRLFVSASLVYSLNIFAISDLAQKQTLHLSATGKTEEGVKVYLEDFRKTQVHSIDTLEQLGLKILDEGFKSSDPQTSLLALFGATTARVPIDRKILTKAFRNANPVLQGLALQVLSNEEMDDTDLILKEGVKSDYLMIRLETLYQLVHRHSRHAMGLVESLKNMIHPQLHFFFPEFYALDGTNESISYLKQMTHDPNLSVRVSALLAAVKYQRDGLLPIIRSVITHPNPLEQEAAAFALGGFRDISAKEKLERLISSKNDDVRLACANALVTLGFFEHKATILELVEKGHPFAISALMEIGGGQDELAKLLQHKDHLTRYRAAWALLKLRDPRCVPQIQQILLTPVYDLNLIPYFSPARTVFSFESYYGPIKEAELKNSIVAFTSYIKEMMLSQILDLGENYFLNIASSILSLKKSELVPAVIQLLENIRSKESILLIKKASQQPGAPFIRAYAHLALYRLGIYQEFDKSTIEFIQESVSKEMISFQPIEMNPQNKIAKNAFQLTPSERSQLLLQTFEALLTRHESSGIELILDSILKGHPNNRYALAGLLLKMIQ